MGSNDHIPVPDPKSKARSIKRRRIGVDCLRTRKGTKCDACGSSKSVLLLSIRLGRLHPVLTSGYRCRSCANALNRSRVRPGDSQLIRCGLRCLPFFDAEPKMTARYEGTA